MDVLSTSTSTPPQTWAAIATAIADRLVENSEVFLLSGDSLRKPKNPNPLAESS